jgi:hypothetical protein
MLREMTVVQCVCLKCNWSGAVVLKTEKLLKSKKLFCPRCSESMEQHYNFPLVEEIPLKRVC